MRSGTGGLKVLAPSAGLLEEFTAEKRALTKAGMAADAAHAEAARRVDYRARYREEILSCAEAVRALRDLVAEAKTRDVYLMCMCPYRTRERACHSYHLLDLARELDPTVRLLEEPPPTRARRSA